MAGFIRQRIYGRAGSAGRPTTNGIPHRPDQHSKSNTARIMADMRLEAETPPRRSRGGMQFLCGMDRLIPNLVDKDPRLHFN